MDIRQKLAMLLRSTPAGGAANALGGRAYQLYVAEAQANGQTPVSPQQFAAGQLQPVAPQPVVEAPPKPFQF